MQKPVLPDKLMIFFIVAFNDIYVLSFVLNQTQMLILLNICQVLLSCQIRSNILSNKVYNLSMRKTNIHLSQFLVIINNKRFPQSTTKFYYALL